MNVVISQSMLFPWVGLLEQIRLSDVFVHYDDVQFSKGSLVNRVQLKFLEGPKWMTIPIENRKLGLCINEVSGSCNDDWRSRHLDLISRSLEGTPYRQDAIDLVAKVYSFKHSNIGIIARSSLIELAKYFGIDRHVQYIDVETLGIPGNGSERVLDIVKLLKGNKYITGHGASNYLDHCSFESAGIEVRYMNYQFKQYPQLHGRFNPYVSGLDLVANCGKDGLEFICSGTVNWREFIK